MLILLFQSPLRTGPGTDLSLQSHRHQRAQLKSFIERGEKEGISPTEAMEMASPRHVGIR